VAYDLHDDPIGDPGRNHPGDGSVAERTPARLAAEPNPSETEITLNAFLVRGFGEYEGYESILALDGDLSVEYRL
jgi:hypothetical protein